MIKGSCREQCNGESRMASQAENNGDWYSFHLLRNTCQNMSYILTEAQLLSSALTSAQELYMEIGEKAAGTI